MLAISSILSTVVILASDALCAFACCLLRAFLVSTLRVDCPCGWVCSFACSWLCSCHSWVLGSFPWLFFFRVHSCLHCPVRGTDACPVRGTDAATQRAPLTLCEALFPRASSALRSYTVTLQSRRGHMADRANLLSAVARRTSATSDSCSF